MTDAHVEFAPPVADLTTRPPDEPRFPFFLVGTPKLVVMTVITIGIYEVYWFYRHWERLRRYGQEDVWPIVRAVFCGFFCYWLFDRMNQEADAQGTPTLLSAGVLTVLYFIGITAGRFDVPLWLALGLTVLPIALAQSVVNRLPPVQTMARAQRNVRLSKKNWAGVIVFGLILLLALLPDRGPVAAAP